MIKMMVTTMANCVVISNATAFVSLLNVGSPATGSLQCPVSLSHHLNDDGGDDDDDNLRTHLKTHSGEKSNKCNQCDFASSHALSLKGHLKTHSGEKSNKCNQCDFASSYASALRDHFKTHIGEK